MSAACPSRSSPNKLNTTAVSIGRYEREDQRLSAAAAAAARENLRRVGIAEIAGDAWQSPIIFPCRCSICARRPAPARSPPMPRRREHLMFREQWLRRIGQRARACSCWRFPAIRCGRRCMTAITRWSIRRRPIRGAKGLYVIRIDDMLQVKRISMHPVKKLLTVKSDNPAYRTYDNIKPDDIAIMGRVVWIGRSLGQVHCARAPVGFPQLPFG
jgi:hypothetical protein